MPMVEAFEHDDIIRPVNSKSVFIAEPETITPGPSPGLPPVDADTPQLSSSPKLYRTNASRRLSGRLPEKQSPSLHSIPSLTSLKSIPTFDAPGANSDDKATSLSSHQHGPNRDSASHIISQVAEWLEQEKAKRVTRKSRKTSTHTKLVHAAEATSALADRFRSEEAKHDKEHHAKHDSDLSESGFALEKLEQILSESMHVKIGETPSTREIKDTGLSHRKSLRKESSKKLMRRSSTALSSDSDHPDNELFVPSSEVVLDNSKTLRYNGGTSTSEVDLTNFSRRATKEKEAWKQFKGEIVTLTHTLRIPGWRRVPIEQSEEISVERLSGALTNAVYVVSPPKELPQTPALLQADAPPAIPKRRPPKLLLRIYGPQVEHLIDRESELQILRRLARKKIGPRLLGTFTNGRFEQFFYAKTLTAADLRVPETSKQIAKRMRELHDGIDLLKAEREGGPFIWRNWDKWVDRCDEMTRWLDHQVLSTTTSERQLKPHSAAWRKRGLVCGVEWPMFRRTVDAYRAWLLKQYDGNGSYPVISKSLVFAHNDTQYGNLLRLEPLGESPLLLPANEHKQLVVIDFEYASANNRGLEFANHFTEWCYNYHSSIASHALNEKAYPSPEEQSRFLKAYVQHRPPAQPLLDDNSNRSNSTVNLSSATTLSQGASGGGSISSFMLDSRAPPTPGGYQEEERQREEAVAHEVERLKHETRLWRVANSAQWVAWGIVQAKVEGMDEALEAARNVAHKSSELGSFANTAQNPPQCAATAGENSGQTRGSDPLSPEMKPLADAARDKRPEEREIMASSTHTKTAPATTTATEREEGDEEAEEEEEEEEETEFDYLGYAQQRALFFWGDVLQLGLVRKEDLPRELCERVKIVEY